MTVSQPGERENIGRGVARALLMVPVGIAAWLVVWNLGFISGWIALLVSVGMLALYRSGARRLSGRGATIVTLLAGGTILTALLAGFAWDVAAAIMTLAGVDALTALADPAFVPLLVDYITGPGLFNVIASLVAATLGLGVIVRAAIQEGRRGDAAAFPGFGDHATAGSRFAPPENPTHAFIGPDPHAVPASAPGPVPTAVAPAIPPAPVAVSSVPAPWNAPAPPAPVAPAPSGGIDWVMPSASRALPAVVPAALEPAPPQPVPPVAIPAPAMAAPPAVAPERTTTGSVPRPPVTRVVTRALEAAPA